jgi:type II restriction enzyme
VDLRLDPNAASGYHSGPQVTKALSEHWISREGFCLKCGGEALQHTPENTKAMDFRCESCDEPYELKASRKPFRNRVLDGEYRTFMNAIASHDNPNLFLLNYDLGKMEVTDLAAIPRHTLSRLTIRPRTPLRASARRAGWQGCNIDLAGLPEGARIQIVASGSPRPRATVMEDWSRFDFVSLAKRTDRDWLPDILSCIGRIQSEDFDLSDVYSFEPELRLLHPKNYNIQPKIRQQLQLLVAQGLLRRVRPGRYQKTMRA